MKILGIDEAGRGPVLGPLVIAGVMADEAGIAALAELGVRDSKALSRKRRTELALKIVQLARTKAITIPADRLEENINEVELQAMADLIGALRPEVVYFDVPAHPRGVGGYCRKLRELVGLKVPAPMLIGENHADRRYPIVAAASIVAKVERDRAILKLHEEYGDFGWGYPSEPKTRRFLEGWYRRHGRFPSCARAKWRTLRRLQQIGAFKAEGVGQCSI
jgi:ribonuclease HII